MRKNNVYKSWVLGGQIIYAYFRDENGRMRRLKACCHMAKAKVKYRDDR